jgi:hypothetical protein
MYSFLASSISIPFNFSQASNLALLFGLKILGLSPLTSPIDPYIASAAK